MAASVSELERYRFDVNLEDLQTFLAVTDLGSFSRAAEQLNLSQPAISNRIRRLEEKIRTRLLNRTTRRVELTPQGTRLYLQSSETLARLRILLREFTGEAAARAREVHVGATMMVASLGLPNLVRLFHAAQPGVRVAVHDLLAHEVIAEVLAGDCDLAVMSLGDPVPGIHYEPLFDDMCVVVTQRDHPLLRYDAAPLSEVLKEPLLTPKGLHDLTTAINGEANRQGLAVRLAPESQEVRNTFTLLAMAAAGLGVCIHPSSFVPIELKTTIGVVPLAAPGIVRTFGIVTAEGSELSPAAAKFCDFIRASVKPGPRPWDADGPEPI
ncbi:LysR family transcriptional regulator [Sphingobium subterraneum]|uniref:DNA-binding transcriptional LysR family regulator n=1 Tax=Sphingobium subterraneum TaxID=627688 RepID=A0A841IZ26_9SPHN|nr:LysR family transcriptional regulator [Sphingobium subterraneum]MBB6123382.1 DNA-binding transcriptional LysR family regulator [Sphingobium subterraneum]